MPLVCVISTHCFLVHFFSHSRMILLCGKVGMVSCFFKIFLKLCACPCCTLSFQILAYFLAIVMTPSDWRWLGLISTILHWRLHDVPLWSFTHWQSCPQTPHPTGQEDLVLFVHNTKHLHNSYMYTYKVISTISYTFMYLHAVLYVHTNIGSNCRKAHFPSQLGVTLMDWINKHRV